MHNIKIILVEPSHTGNIGSVARSMKTMGLSHLCLVNPKQPIDDQAYALAAGAKDILQQAQLVNSFEQAVAECHWIYGTSARLRHLQNTLIEPREAALKVYQQQHSKVALVFGRERVGLTNQELLKCHYHICIPANPDYSSLNLAMAVQIIGYELRMAWLAQQPQIRPENINSKQVTQQEIEHLLTHSERVYDQIGFIKNSSVMEKLRRFYMRGTLEKSELQIFRGILSAIERHIRK